MSSSKKHSGFLMKKERKSSDSSSNPKLPSLQTPAQGIQLLMTNIQQYSRGKVEQDFENKLRQVSRAGTSPPDRNYSTGSLSRLATNLSVKFDPMKESHQTDEIVPRTPLKNPMHYVQTTATTKARLAETSLQREKIFSRTAGNFKQHGRSQSDLLQKVPSLISQPERQTLNHFRESSITKGIESDLQSSNPPTTESKQELIESKRSLSIFPKKRIFFKPVEVKDLPVILSSRIDQQSDFSPNSNKNSDNLNGLTKRGASPADQNTSSKQKHSKAELGLTSARNSIDYSKLMFNSPRVFSGTKSKSGMRRKGFNFSANLHNRKDLVYRLMNSNKYLADLETTESKIFEVCSRLVALLNHCLDIKLPSATIDMIIRDVEGKKKNELRKIFLNFKNGFKFDELEIFRICQTGKIRPQLLGYSSLHGLSANDSRFQISDKRVFTVKLSQLRIKLSSLLAERKEEAVNFQGDIINGLLQKRLGEQKFIELGQNLRYIMNRTTSTLDLNDVLLAFNKKQRQNRPVHSFVAEYKRHGLEVNLEAVNPDVMLQNRKAHKIDDEIMK